MRRRMLMAAIASVLLPVSCAIAQTPVPIPKVASPETTPTQNAPVKTSETPLPPEPGFIRFRADNLKIYEDNRVVGKGNVRAQYERYAITSDEAISDPGTNVATFTGNVALSGQGLSVHGKEMSLNLKTRQWRLLAAESAITPENFKVGVLAPVFIKGKELAGTEDNRISVVDGSMTTCDRETPHYVLTAKEVDVYPGVKLIARRVTFYALGHKLISLPAFAIPLNYARSRTNLIPQVGQTAAEGFFIKSAYNYMATKSNTGLLRLDLMSKKGVGEGIEHTYRFGTAVGSITAYHLFDRTLNADSVTGRIAHKQTLGNVLLDVSSDYRSNSYQYAPQSTSGNTQLSLIRNVNGASTSLLVRQTVTTGFGDFNNLTSSLQHRQKIAGVNSSLALDFARFASPGVAGNLELNSRVELSKDLSSYSWKLNLAKRFDLDKDSFVGDSNFSSLDKVPELTLETDTKRLGHTLPLKTQANLGLSVGRYREEPFGVDTERVMFDLSTMPRVLDLSGSTKLTYGLGFRQSVYGNEAAQYVISANTGIRRKIGEKSAISLDYRYQRPRGVSAFRFDYASAYNVLTSRLDLRETEKFKLSLYSGYNFAIKEFPWQDITLRAWYAPSKSFGVYTSTGYDLNHARWRSLINQFQVRLPYGLKMDLGTRYDIVYHKLGTARMQLDTPVGKKTKFQALLGYNGFSGMFDYKALMLTRDLHCWEASLAYVDQNDFYSQKGFQFSVRIKAFPLFDQFGVGQRGQSLMDTSMGEVF